MGKHILIIPSEEFQPKNNKLAGIFQLHQAKALEQLGIKVGIISIRQELSIPMLFKQLLLKLSRKEVHKSLKNKAIGSFLKLLYRKIFSISSFIMEEEIEGFTVYRIEGFYYLPPNEKTNFFGWTKAGESVFKHYLKKQGKPDIIHAHNALYGGLLARKISEKYTIPYLITEHSSYFSRGLVPNTLYSKVLDAYKSSNCLAVVSPFLGKELTRIIGVSSKKWKWIPNVLEKEFEQFINQPLGRKNKDTFIFISIGSFIPIKGHLDLIKAFSDTFSPTEKVFLKIYGGGPLRNHMIQLVQKLNRAHQIHIGEYLNRKEIINLFKQSHCFVLPSEIETFGVVLIEAMSFGLPVLATKCGGPEYIVNESNGILIPPKNTVALKKSLRKLFQDYNHYDAKKIQHYVLDTFGSQAVTKKLIQEYQLIND